ncbi:MAG: hypothetical protein J1F11_10790 [Oscillospiraceae bacterium]|nr:hypothetical protein [Oscillospiraceae bacterium]
MNMKLSYRDKVVFIVVIVILILVAGFFLLIKPKFEEIDTAKYNLETKQSERDEIDQKIATLSVLIEDMKTAAKDIDERQGMFMTEQDPYLNEMYIRDIFARYNVKYSSFQTDYTGAGGIYRYTVSPAHILAYDNKIIADLYNELPQEVYDVYNRVQAEAYPDSIIGVTTMNITFDNDDDFRTAYNMIDAIAGDELTVLVTSANLEKTNKDVSMSIVAYSINPVNVEKVLEETDDIKPLETPPAE